MKSNGYNPVNPNADYQGAFDGPFPDYAKKGYNFSDLELQAKMVQMRHFFVQQQAAFQYQQQQIARDQKYNPNSRGRDHPRYNSGHTDPFPDPNSLTPHPQQFQDYGSQQQQQRFRQNGSMPSNDRSYNNGGMNLGSSGPGPNASRSPSSWPQHTSRPDPVHEPGQSWRQGDNQSTQIDYKHSNSYHNTYSAQQQMANFPSNGPGNKPRNLLSVNAAQGAQNAHPSRRGHNGHVGDPRQYRAGGQVNEADLQQLPEYLRGRRNGQRGVQKSAPLHFPQGVDDSSLKMWAHWRLASSHAGSFGDYNAPAPATPTAPGNAARIRPSGSNSQIDDREAAHLLGDMLLDTVSDNPNPSRAQIGNAFRMPVGHEQSRPRPGPTTMSLLPQKQGGRAQMQGQDPEQGHAKPQMGARGHLQYSHQQEGPHSRHHPAQGHKMEEPTRQQHMGQQHARYQHQSPGRPEPIKGNSSLLRHQAHPEPSPMGQSSYESLSQRGQDLENSMIGYGTPRQMASSNNSQQTSPSGNGMRIHNLQSPAVDNASRERQPMGTPEQGRSQQVTYIPQTPPRAAPSPGRPASQTRERSEPPTAARRPPLRNSLAERRNPPGLHQNDRSCKHDGSIPSPKTDPQVDLEQLQVLSMPAKPPLPEPLLSSGEAKSTKRPPAASKPAATKIPRLSRPAHIRNSIHTTIVPHPARQDGGRNDRGGCPPGLRNPTNVFTERYDTVGLPSTNRPTNLAKVNKLASTSAAKKAHLTPPKAAGLMGNRSSHLTPNGASPSTETLSSPPKKRRGRGDRDDNPRRRRGDRRGGRGRRGHARDDDDDHSHNPRDGRSRRGRVSGRNAEEPMERKPPKPSGAPRKPIPMVSSATRERRLKQQQSKEKKLRNQLEGPAPVSVNSKPTSRSERNSRESRKRGNRSEKRDRGKRERGSRQIKSTDAPSARSQPPRRSRGRDDKASSRSVPRGHRGGAGAEPAPTRKRGARAAPAANGIDRPARVSDTASDDDGPAAVDATPRAQKKLNIRHPSPKPKKEEPKKPKTSPSTNQFAMLMMDGGESSSDGESDAEPPAPPEPAAPTPEPPTEEPVIRPASPRSTQAALDALRAMDGSESKGSINPRIWKRSAIEEKEQIKRFWHALTKRERGHLVKVSKQSILNLLATQQRIVCTCSVCQRRRRLVSEEIAELYDTFYWELDKVDRHSQPTADVPDLSRWSNEDADLSVRVRAGVMTINDELLKQEGKMFLEMMDKVAEQKLHQKETSDASTCSMDRPLTSLVENGQRQETRCRRAPCRYRAEPELTQWGDEDAEEGPEMSSEHSYVPENFEERQDEHFQDTDTDARAPRPTSGPAPDGDVCDASEPSPLPPGSESGEPFDYEEEQYSASDTEMAEIDAEGRLEEARRLFGLFAAKLFHQRVFNAYLEQICSQRQEELIRELEEEEARKMRRKLKKKLKRFKRKERQGKSGKRK